jgi:hypothetical protein
MSGRKLNKSAVQVVVRFRPLNDDETRSDQIHRLNTDMIRVRNGPSNTSQTPTQIGRSGGTFQFHRVFGPRAVNNDLYEHVCPPLLDAIFKGEHATLMAYGQTGTGKTFTMRAHVEDTGHPDRGLVARCLQDMCSRIEARQPKGWHSKIRLSMIQIYMERVLDLLNPSAGCLAVRQRNLPDKSVDIFVEGAKWITVHGAQEAMGHIVQGTKHRVVAATNANASSSRSHCVCIVELEQMLLDGTQPGD